MAFEGTLLFMTPDELDKLVLDFSLSLQDSLVLSLSLPESLEKERPVSLNTVGCDFFIDPLGTLCFSKQIFCGLLFFCSLSKVFF